MFTIEQAIMPFGNGRSGLKLNPGARWIIIHETANTDKGAGADNHVKYFNRLNSQGSTKKSCHFIVDDKKIVQLIPLDEVAWCNTDGRTAYKKDPPKGGNMAGISIEMCVNKDGDFEETLRKTIWLVAKLMKDFNLTINEVKQHNDFYKKNCPKILRETGRWEWFLEQVQAKYNEITNTAPAPEPPTPPPPTLFEEGYVVTIKPGAVYGGLASARGKPVPKAQTGAKKHTIKRIQVNKGVAEALLREINSWVALTYLVPVGQATAPPSQPKPTPTPAGIKYQIICKSLNIRKGPGTSYPVTGSYLKKGDIVTVTETKGSWGKHAKGWSNLSPAYAKKI